MKYSLLLIIVLVALSISVSADPTESVEITLAATTDLHCRLNPDSLSGGGLASVVAELEDLRSERSHLVLLDAGDAFEGSADADYYALVDTTDIHPLAAAMNDLGYAAMAVGNHEFTYGVRFLNRIRDEVSFPLLAANITQNGIWWPGHTLITEGDISILVVGTCTPFTASLEAGAVGDSIQFHDQVLRLGELIPSLRARYKPDVVCVLAHTGPGKGSEGTHPENRGLDLTGVPGIDVLFLGHTHGTFNETVNGVLVLQAGSRGSHLATADLTLQKGSAGWNIVEKSGTLIDTRHREPDERYHERFTTVSRPVEQWLNEPVGSLGEPLSANRSASRMDPVTQLMGEVMQTAARTSVAFLPVFPEDFRLEAGMVLRRDLYRLQPYLNSLVTIEMTRDSLVEALEYAASVWDDYPYDGSYPPPIARGRSIYGFLAISGIDYVLDYRNPPGERVVGFRMPGRPVPGHDTVSVVVSSYYRTGPFGYHWFSQAPESGRTTRWLRSYLEEWFRSHPEYVSPESRGWYSRPSYQGVAVQPVLDELIRDAGFDFGSMHPSSFPSFDDAMATAVCILGFEPSPELRQALVSPGGIKRGPVLTALLHALPEPVSDPSCAGTRFDDVDTNTIASVWDSVAANGLVAYLEGSELITDASMNVDDLLLFLANTRFRHLTIASTNDFHGAIERNTRRGQAGVSGLSAWLTEARRENPNGVVLLDAGDAMQGTPISNLFNGSSTISFYNDLGYDALAVGNHDFDWGQEILSDRADQAEFPFLGANVVSEKTGAVPSFLAPWTVIDRGGVRVGVLGICTPSTPWITLASNVAGLEFQSPAGRIGGWVRELRTANPDIIVLLGHMGIERMGDTWKGESFTVAEEAAGLVDVFFNGHTHQLYKTEIAGLPLLQGASSGRAISVVHAGIDRFWDRPAIITASVETLDPERFSDPAMEPRVRALKEELAPLTQVVVTTLASEITREVSESGEMPMGRVIAESQLNMVPGAQVALMNKGGVRAGLDAGPVTWQELYTVQPFGNTLMKATLTGRELLSALEHGMTSTGATIQIAGIELTVDRTKPYGSRILSATLEDGTPVRPDGLYITVFNNFIGSGGDGYIMLRDAEQSEDTGYLDLNALINYLQKQPQPVSIDLDPRIHLSNPR